MHLLMGSTDGVLLAISLSNTVVVVVDDSLLRAQYDLRSFNEASKQAGHTSIVVVVVVACILLRV